MPRELPIHVSGILTMLVQWAAKGEVYRASWHMVKDQMRIFRPFVASCELNAPLQVDGSRLISVDDWLQALEAGGKDDLDLRLHEAWKHGILDKRDFPGDTGIGSNNAAKRAATTTPAERLEAMRAVRARWDVVRITGLARKP